MFKRTAVAIAAALSLCACGGAELDGSLGEAFDLTFSSIKLRRAPSAFQITYLRSEGREVVARITVQTDGLNLDRPFPLDGEYAPGHPRTTVSRAVDGEPSRTMPRVSQGTMQLSDLPEPGQVMSGEFSLSFEGNGEIGAGTTLTGRFEGKVEEAL